MAAKIGQIQIEFVARTEQLQGQIDGINKKINTTTGNVRRNGKEWDEQVTKMQAASAAIRSLNGDLNTRAVERYIAQFKGLSTLLQTIFPLVGAIALTGVVVRLGERIYEAGEKARTAGTEIRNAFNKLNGEAETANDKLEQTNDKLEDQIAKLTGRHPNVLRDELDDVITAADDLADALQNDADKIDQLMKKYNVGFKDMLADAVVFGENPMLTHGVDKKVGYDEQENENNSYYSHVAINRLNQAKDDLVRAKATNDKSAIASATAQVADARKAMTGELDKSIGALKRQTAGYEQQLQHFYEVQRISTKIDTTANKHPFTLLPLYADTGRAADPTANIAKLEQLIRANKDTMREIELKEKNAELKPKVAAATEAKDNAAKAKTLFHQQTEALVASWREREDKLKNEGDQTKQQEYNFWKAMKAEADAGQNAYSAAVNAVAAKVAFKEMGTAYQAAEKQIKEEDKKLLAEMTSSIDELQKKAASLAPALVWRNLSFDNTDHPYGASADEMAKRSTEIERQQATLQSDLAKMARNTGLAFREQAVQIALASGELSKHDAAVALEQIHADAFKASIEDITAERQTLISDNREGANNTEINRLTVEIAKAQDQHTLQQASDEDKINSPLGEARDAINEWTQAALDSASQIKALVNSTLGGFNDAVVSNKRGAYQQYGQSLFKNLEKTGLERAEGYGMKALGFGKAKADGSAGSPWHVIVDGMKTAASSLFGRSNSGSTVAGLASTFAKTGGSGNILSDFLKIGGGILGFADGGDPPVGVPSLVGENGPELFVPRSAGSVVSNGKFGTGDTHNHYIDARGSNDPAQTVALIHRYITAAAPQMVKHTLNMGNEFKVRRPSTAHG